MASRSRRVFSREVCFLVRLPRKRGRRECRARDAPAASHAVKNKAYECSHHEYTGMTRHSPRNGFTAYFVLSPVTGLVCHRRPRGIPANLTPASGCQDHTTSPSASAPFVKSASASTASRPASVTIAKRPLVGRDGGHLQLICAGRKHYFRFRKIFSEIRHSPSLPGGPEAASPSKERPFWKIDGCPGHPPALTLRHRTAEKGQLHRERRAASCPRYSVSAAPRPR